jgi:1-deoxy-D-xylulose-5-phosphate reductoisomerase
MPHRQRLAILGATGSIGVNTLDVALRHPDRFRVVALTAHRQVERLYEQCLAAQPVYAVVQRQEDAALVQRQLRDAGCPTQVLWGAEALVEVAASIGVDTVMSAIVGAAGLPPTLAAVRAGKKVLLANKEALVMAGALFMAEVKACGAVLLPVDSEHNAVFQSLPERRSDDLRHNGVRSLLLTASGGPFRTSPLEALRAVTPDQACAHPNWVMGKKISVDSATMMNKGLEVIEAHWLFGVPPEMIEVVIHPQSVIHSMVSYEDGSVIAELGNPDMRTPIAHALAYPERIAAGVGPLDLCAIGQLSFEKPDFERFPCLGLAYRALKLGGTAPAILNAANEVAVQAFLEGDLPFLSIPQLIAQVLESLEAGAADSLEAILDADAQAREMARGLLASMRQSD